MYVNRRDLLMAAIAGIAGFEDRLTIIDNSHDQGLELDDFAGKILRPPAPLYCSESYNLILTEAVRRRLDLFFIMHSDALASPEIIESMVTRAEELNEEGRKWGVMFSNYDVLALHNTKALKGMEWDNNLPLYYTDVDFYYRLKLAGIEIIETGLPVIHQEAGSSVIRSDPGLANFVYSNMSKWQAYYNRKWGGDRDHETFTVPFDGK